MKIKKLAKKILCFFDMVIFEYIVFEVKGFLRKKKVIDKDNTNKILSLKDKYVGKKCYIVATGPSLPQDMLSEVKDGVTIGVNSIIKIYEEKNWMPDYYVCIDPVNFANLNTSYRVCNKRLSKEMAILNYKSKKIIKEYGCKDEYAFVELSSLDHKLNNLSTKFKKKSDIVGGIYGLYTVVNTAIILAEYMGIKEIYLIGVDCNYSGNNKYAFEDKTKAHITADLGSVLEYEMAAAYKYIAKEMDKSGVKIYNTSVESKLDVFEKISLNEALSR